jgi:copper(I)-binding protein
LVVVLTDASGAPITDATVAVEGNMNHAGMIPVLADPTADDADGNADGRYHLPFTFTMLGDWIITVTVTQADGSNFSRNLEIRSGSDGFEGDALLPLEDASSTNVQAEGSVINIHDAMARPAPLAGGTGAVYFTLHNGSENSLKWIGADSPAASAVEIHTTINDNGVMRMRQITDGVEIAPDEMIELTPGAMHLMLVDLVAPLAEGDTVAVTLHFEGADDFTFDAPVVNMDSLPAEGEMEHNH